MTKTFVRFDPRQMGGELSDFSDLSDAPPANADVAKAETGSASALVEYAARTYGAVVRLTLRETADIAGDLALLHLIRAVIEEWEQVGGDLGGNHIVVRIVTLDGGSRRAEWRAFASRELRLAIARLLAADAARGRWPLAQDEKSESVTQDAISA